MYGEMNNYCCYFCCCLLLLLLFVIVGGIDDNGNEYACTKKCLRTKRRDLLMYRLLLGFILIIVWIIVGF